ncbi:MAG: hypothetical protein HYS81_01560 [Candidatus Aenigmatarchaeota archaeon]|nr:MAG: hypothetical protein HYS81_01560 [Candidatus Aenigmarchaeota archaeon]
MKKARGKDAKWLVPKDERIAPDGELLVAPAAQRMLLEAAAVVTVGMASEKPVYLITNEEKADGFTAYALTGKIFKAGGKEYVRPWSDVTDYMTAREALKGCGARTRRLSDYTYGTTIIPTKPIVDFMEEAGKEFPSASVSNRYAPVLRMGRVVDTEVVRALDEILRNWNYKESISATDLTKFKPS